ncbi:MAG TPA: hypothetical protein DDW90_00810 [Cyanobacteria bacterium UBA9971]|nr:hypothetical protein [Cyanobacteria bacterium UBA9971]
MNNVSFQKNPAYYAAQKTKLNAPLKDAFTVRKTPGSMGLTPRPTNLTQPTGFEYKGFETKNPAIRLLKAVSKLFN